MQPADEPYALRSEVERAARREAPYVPHMAALTSYVEQIRTAHRLTREIPDFYPGDGGTEAQALFLLEAPGPKAVETGFISRGQPGPDHSQHVPPGSRSGH